MLYNEYDPATLKRLQDISLEILLDFDKFCSENGIDYFGCGGTAIGAVRHGGFIPWDDDIDVGMTRKNYDKFLALALEKLTDKYNVITFRTTENFPLMNARFTLKGTKFREDCFKDLEFDNGIFLDIFCFDNIYDDEKKMKKQMWKAWFWGKMLILWHIDTPVLYFKGFREKVVLFLCKIGHVLLRLFHRKPDRLFNRAEKYATMLKDEQTKRVAYIFDPTPFTSVVNLSDIEPTKTAKFEGYDIRFPNSIEAYLNVRYGSDYMTLPPEDKRHNHPPYELQFPEDDKTQATV